MTLPVSSYEALLDQVRQLTHETILLQRQLSSDLYQNVVDNVDVNHNLAHYQKDYEQGKLVIDNVIRRCDTKIDIGQRTFIDRNEFAFHPHLTPSLDCARQTFDSGELTARLIAWRDQNCQRSTNESNAQQRDNEDDEDDDEEDDDSSGTPVDVNEKERRIGIATRDSQLPVQQHQVTRTIIPRYQPKISQVTRNHDKQEERTVRRSKQSDTTGIPSLERVGVEGGGTSSSLSWESGVSSTREGTNIVRPYYAAGDPPLNHERTTAEPQSTVGVPSVVSPTTLVSSSTESREQCSATRFTSLTQRRSYVKDYDMESDTKEDNEPNSGISSPELYATSTKRYDEDASSEEDSKHDETHRLSSLYHGTWPVKRDQWMNQQMNYHSPRCGSTGQRNDTASVMSFSSSTGASGVCSAGMQGHRRLGAKVDVVYSLLGMLGSSEGREDMSSTLLAMSNSIDSCLVMRQSGCLPLLVQLIHAPGQDIDTRERAARALHNVIHARADEKAGRREARVLRLLEQVRDYCQALRASLETERPPDDLERHPGPTIAALMKLSFDEAHRHAMCQFGGLHAVAELIEMDHAAHGSDSDDQSCITLRRYAGMALTNLTFGDGNNKALLCSFRGFMRALVSQLRSLSDDLRQVTASVLRNLSWRADSSSKQTLREVGAVTGLMKAAMEGRKESTLKSILSALWNLSAHCSTNKVDICAVEGALAFLVDMLSYKAPSKTLSIVENAGGILRNVSSHIAVREDYRAIVRERDCLQVLLRQLRSPSLTVVSNACGALWNLSARCPHDQRLLWDLGAVPMLRSLVHSKHKMISMGSSAALKNLLSARPAGSNLVHLDSTARGLGLPTLPTLVARRQRALEQEIDQNLAETCDNIEPSTSPTNKDDKFPFKVDRSFVDIAARGRSYRMHANQSTPSSSMNNGGGVPRSDSRESMRSVTSTHSDTIFERVNRHMSNGLTPSEIDIKQQSSSLHSALGFNAQATPDSHNRANQKYALRYKNSIPERLRPTDLGVNEIADLRCTTSTVSWTTGPDQESACSQILMHSPIEDSVASPIGTPFISLGRNSADCGFKETSQTLDSEVNYKSPCVGSPIGNPTIVPSLVEPKVVHCETANAENIPCLTLVNCLSDIDQPTNYSLRYAELNSDEDEKHNSGYFATGEQGIEDTVETYYTERTPYETPLASSGAASDTDLPEVSGIKPPMSLKIPLLRRINDAAREKRGQVASKTQKSSNVLQSEVDGDTVEISAQDDSVNNVSALLPNTLEHVSEIKDSSDSQANAAQPEPIKTTFAVDTASGMETAVARLNSLVLNDEPKIINDSSHKEREAQSLARRQELEMKAESFPESMVSDGDEDDEDLLAACIHIGMQNNRHRQSFRRNSLEKTPPAESNLARYQTSTALDRVETNGFTERPSQSDPQKFNIQMISTVPSEDHLQPDAGVTNGYQSFEDNFNIVNDDDKITVEYRKLQEYSCEQDAQRNLDYIDGNLTSKGTKSLQLTSRDTRANSVEDNTADSEICVDSTISSDSNKETRDSESIESFDSVERSEQALLELCIRSDTSKEKPAITTSESNTRIATIAPKIASSNEEEEKREADTVIGQVDDISCSRTNQAKSVEDEYRRQRDPDAMIASLDRLTATLVQQTEAMRERESSAMKQSVLSDTWNEDSPNDVSYPSISVSAPLIASFKSDVDDESALIAMPTLREGENGDSPSMTNSRIIEREAIRLAEAVSAEATRQQIDFGATSLSSSNDIEAIRPPSTMNSLISLTASYVGPFESCETSYVANDRCQSTSLSPVRVRGQYPSEARNGRKKSLPVGVMAKRALAQGTIGHTTSLESLLNDCSLGTNSQLENVKPPSMMDELLDTGDMENSMLSVASITSEIAETKDQDSNSLTGSDPVFDLLKPVANVLSLTCKRYGETLQTSANDSISEYLENINPPSLFNEVSEMDDSTVEANTDTLCSDTLCIDADLRTEEAPHPIIVDRIEEVDNDTDEAATPIHTESCYSSSAESTPKKRQHKNHLTPKQKRQLAKERYKTYTIAAELVKKEEEERRKQEAQAETAQAPRGKLSPYTKLTPKQRRQEDRARFQTQVLDSVPLPDFVTRVSEPIEQAQMNETRENVVEPTSPIKSSIPTLLNLCGSKTFRKKRTIDDREMKDRYRTRTLTDVDTLPTNGASLDDCSEERIGDPINGEIASEAMQTMLERNANIVLHTLNETTKVTDNIGEDAMLDCETLSLVSNDSESEHSLRMRFASGLGKKLMTNYVQKANSQRALYLKQEETEPIVENGSCDREERVLTAEVTPEVSDTDSDNELPNAEEKPEEPKRPRIIKPGTVSRDRSVDSNPAEKSEPASPKGIRGRRRALYSTPNANKTPPQSSPLKQLNNVSSAIPIGRSNTSPIVRATRATTLRQNTNTSGNSTKDTPKSGVTQKIPQITYADKRARSAALAKRSSIPQRGSTYAATKSVKRHSTPPGCASNPAKEAKMNNTPSPPKPLERQGTFTKDEPEVENAPTVVICPSPSKSKIAKPTKGSPVRVNPAAAGKSKISVRTYQNSQQSRLTKCSSAEKIQFPRVTPSIANRVDNLNAQGTEIGKTPRRIMSLGQRSNSNSSIVSSSATPGRKIPKEATSKIASLWKKVEESKNKQRFEKPDSRQWITAPSDKTDSAEVAATSEQPAFRLFRSSTFEGVPQESDDILSATISKRSSKPFDVQANGSKYRNSCDLTGMTQADAPCKIPVKSTDSRTNGKEITIDSGTIVLRKQRTVETSEVDGTKRISRLGSFIRVDSTEGEDGQPRPSENSPRTPVSTIVSPFNYNLRPEVPISVTTKATLDEEDTFDCATDIITGSSRITTV